METIIVILIVALAVLYLGWRSAHTFLGTRKPGCASSCGGCASKSKPTVVPLALGRKSKMED